MNSFQSGVLQSLFQYTSCITICPMSNTPDVRCVLLSYVPAVALRTWIVNAVYLSFHSHTFALRVYCLIAVCFWGLE